MESRPVRFELRNVSKGYAVGGGVQRPKILPVLSDINLKLYDGCVNALVGKSGSGKSTLSRLLMRLEPVDSGTILFKNEPMQLMPLKDFRRVNQIMFQNPYQAVNPYFRCGKIMAEPLRILRMGHSRIYEKVNRMVEILKIPAELLGRYPAELSGGQLQRVVLARSLLLEPEFLILDEPLSALDEIMATRLLTFLKEVFEKLGVGVLYISHHMERVRYLSHVVSVIQNNKLSFHGNRSEYIDWYAEQQFDG